MENLSPDPLMWSIFQNDLPMQVMEARMFTKSSWLVIDLRVRSFGVIWITDPDPDHPRGTHPKVVEKNLIEEG